MLQDSSVRCTELPAGSSRGSTGGGCCRTYPSSWGLKKGGVIAVKMQQIRACVRTDVPGRGVDCELTVIGDWMRRIVERRPSLGQRLAGLIVPTVNHPTLVIVRCSCFQGYFIYLPTLQESETYMNTTDLTSGICFCYASNDNKNKPAVNYCLWLTLLYNKMRCYVIVVADSIERHFIL